MCAARVEGAKGDETIFHFGGQKGTLHMFQPEETAGKIMTIFAGEVIDGIQIGNTLCGRGSDNPHEGGGIKVQVTLPDDSCFIINRLVLRTLPDKYTTVVSYIDAHINGHHIYAGRYEEHNSHGAFKDNWEGSMKVSIVGIQGGAYVDGIVFQKV